MRQTLKHMEDRLVLINVQTDIDITMLRTSFLNNINKNLNWFRGVLHLLQTQYKRKCEISKIRTSDDKIHLKRSSPNT